MVNVLIADDNKQIIEILKTYLVKEGYDVSVAYDGAEALERFALEPFDLLLLDVMMPKVDGFEVCKQIRETSNVPIIMVTARGDDFDRIMGLDLGADDYIVKPFVAAEVVARIRAILRRIGSFKKQNIKVFDNLSVDLDRFEVKVDDVMVSLTKKEVEILWTLMESPNRVFTRDNLLDTVWGVDYYGDARTVDSHIKRLRAKLTQKQEQTWSIATVWGLGYKFEVSHDEA